MMGRDAMLATLATYQWNVTAVARVLGIHPTTLAYRMKTAGIVRPHVAPGPVECHPPTAQLLATLEALRSQARAVVHTYLPGPHRAAHLRALEIQQRAIRAQLTALLASAETERPAFTRRPTTWDLWR